MACVDHTCECGHVWCDNSTGECPQCGSSEVSSHFDEPQPEPEEEES